MYGWKCVCGKIMSVRLCGCLIWMMRVFVLGGFARLTQWHTHRQIMKNMQKWFLRFLFWFLIFSCFHHHQTYHFVLKKNTEKNQKDWKNEKRTLSLLIWSILRFYFPFVCLSIFLFLSLSHIDGIKR